MKLQIGDELIYGFPQPTSVVLVVNVRGSRAADLIVRDDLVAEPHTPTSGYHDSFGNHCHRMLAPAGRLRLTAATLPTSRSPAAVRCAHGCKPTCRAGWIDLEPTNSTIGNRNLVRVAVAWSPEHVLPLWGTYSGPPDSFVAMDVEVRVTEESGQHDA